MIKTSTRYLTRITHLLFLEHVVENKLRVIRERERVVGEVIMSGNEVA